MTASKETKQWWKKILDPVLEEVGAVLKEQNKRIAALEAKLMEFGYKGVWQPGIVYRESNFVTDGGSIWVCIKDQSTRRPGDGGDWRLAVKRGRDGKDARQ